MAVKMVVVKVCGVVVMSAVTKVCNLAAELVA